MKLKAGVKLEGASWRVWHAALVAEDVLAGYGSDLVVTSVCDGKHSERSLHYKGLALDIRTRTLKANKSEAVVVAHLKTALSPDYDVVLEGDHIHIEYDPK